MPGEDRQAKEKLCTNTTQASDADQAVEVKVCHEATSEEMAMMLYGFLVPTSLISA
jgi:hypothetical protein